MSEKSILGQIRIRRATDGDVPFIFNSWLKSYRNSWFAKLVLNPIYFDQHHKILERLAKTSEILVACNNEDIGQIYGYICAEKIDGVFVLHYCYVKHTFRGMGIAKELLNVFDHKLGDAAFYTHHTRIAESLSPKYSMIYNPYLLLNDTGKEKANVESSGEVKERISLGKETPKS